MKKILLSITLCLTLGNLSAQTSYSKEIEDQIKQVENNLSGRVILNGKTDNIADRMAFYKVKGLSIAVVNNYQLVWAKGYGWADEKEQRRVTTATLFKPGSISKSLNAVGVLKLAQDNKLDLYKDINEYLTSWKFPYDSLSKGKKITTANLLSHTAGLSVYGGFPGYDAKSRIPTIPQILDGREPANTPPVRSLFEPGLQFQYSGGGIIISQLIITDLTHQPYEKFMFDHVLKPLGMIHSFFSAAPPAKNELNKLALGYTKDGAEVEATFHVYPEQAPMGLWTTPTDLSKYVIETQLAYAGKSSKVLNRQMATLQLTPYIDNSATMGAFIGDRNGEKYFFHDAGNEGYRGLYYGSVEGGTGVVIFVNSDDGNIILELLNSVASVYKWKGFDKPANINTVMVPETITQKYLGVYLYEGKIAEITKEKDGLVYWANNQSCKIYFTSENDFINMEFPTEKSFITDGSGNVTGYSRKLNGNAFPPATKVVRADTIKPNEGELNAFGWHLLETKRFDEAILYLNRGIELEPNENGVLNNLAHCYLFKNEYDKAIKLYKEFIAKGINEQASQKNLIKEDFAFFLKNGFDKVLIAKATAELKL
ncbi:MAG: serine hydrolase [Bacteroidetes bacterium]|nr:serine hydrolase [Bacteroidota bacterium]